MSGRVPEVLDERPFLTDGGLETTLIFHQGLDLPSFASFVLLKDGSGRQALRDYFEPYLAIAAERGTGFVLDTATWRANPDWGPELGYSPEELEQANRDAVARANHAVDQDRSHFGLVLRAQLLGQRDGIPVGLLELFGRVAELRSPVGIGAPGRGV